MSAGCWSPLFYVVFCIGLQAAAQRELQASGSERTPGCGSVRKTMSQPRSFCNVPVNPARFLELLIDLVLYTILYLSANSAMYREQVG